MCAACFLMDTWPGIKSPCRGKASPKKGISTDDLMGQMAELMVLFLDWWIEQGHSETLPTLDEWFAEVIEWRRSVIQGKIKLQRH